MVCVPSFLSPCFRLEIHCHSNWCAFLDKSLFFSGCFPDVFFVFNLQKVIIYFAMNFLWFILFSVYSVSCICTFIFFLAVLAFLSLNTLSFLLSLCSSLSETLLIQMLVLLLESDRFLRVCSVVFSLFSLFLGLKF